MKLEVHYKDGREYGSFKQWYENGQPRVESIFMDGKKEGKELALDKEGKLKSELNYLNGEVLQ